MDSWIHYSRLWKMHASILMPTYTVAIHSRISLVHYVRYPKELYNGKSICQKTNKLLIDWLDGTKSKCSKMNQNYIERYFNVSTNSIKVYIDYIEENMSKFSDGINNLLATNLSLKKIVLACFEVIDKLLTSLQAESSMCLVLYYGILILKFFK